MPRFPGATAPRSWYQLAWSDEVPRGPGLRLRAFDTELHIARGEEDDGRIDVRDARRDRAWPAIELHGMIYAYHDERGEPPRFALPEIPEVSSPRWLPIGRIELTYPSHIQEVVENSVDLAHFQLLHNFTRPAELRRFEVDAHTFCVTVRAPKRVFGATLTTELTISYHGMGLAIGRTEQPFPFLSLVTCLPLHAGRLRQRLTMYVKAPRIPVVKDMMAALLRWHVRRDLADEVLVLEHKRYLERPVLVAGDGPIMRVRRWCRQFYAPPGEAGGDVTRDGGVGGRGALNDATMRRGAVTA